MSSAYSSSSLFENGKIFCVFSSTAEGKSDFSLLILKQTPPKVLFSHSELIASDKIGFRDCLSARFNLLFWIFKHQKPIKQQHGRKATQHNKEKKQSRERLRRRKNRTNNNRWIQNLLQLHKTIHGSGR